MTAQVRDKIIMDNHEYSISFKNILHIPYNHKKIEKDKPKITTATYKGFVAYWEIIGNRIFLLDIDGSYKKLFKSKLFAKWLNGKIMINLTEDENQINFDFDDENLEDSFTQLHLIVENGVIINKNFFKKKKNVHLDIDYCFV